MFVCDPEGSRSHLQVCSCFLDLMASTTCVFCEPTQACFQGLSEMGREHLSLPEKEMENFSPSSTSV